MNLSLIKDFFAFNSVIEAQYKQQRNKITKFNAYTLFMALFSKPSSHITSEILINFIKSFSYSFTELSPQVINQLQIYKFITTQSPLSNDQLLHKGAKLLIQYWGSNDTISYDQFSQLVKGELQFPKKDEQITFKGKKYLFDFLKQQIQNQLDLAVFKKALAYQYNNPIDLFELLTASNTITSQDISNLFFMYNEIKSQQEIEDIVKRLRFPGTISIFKQLFRGKQPAKKKKEMLIYHSIKRNDKNNSAMIQSKFQTPQISKQQRPYDTTALPIKTSTPMGILRQSMRNVSEFHLKEVGQVKPNKQIIGQIIKIEQDFINQKRQIVMRVDCDLQVVYQKWGDKFQDILNERYGMCNFSAFVRFFVPQDLEHKYLAFIRYNVDNALTYDTNKAIQRLIELYYQKQQYIQQLWSKLNRKLIFRGFCLPKQKDIDAQQLAKYFTCRQLNILLDRMDPHKLGKVPIQAFR